MRTKSNSSSRSGSFIERQSSSIRTYMCAVHSLVQKTKTLGSCMHKCLNYTTWDKVNKLDANTHKKKQNKWHKQTHTGLKSCTKYREKETEKASEKKAATVKKKALAFHSSIHLIARIHLCASVTHTPTIAQAAQKINSGKTSHELSCMRVFQALLNSILFFSYDTTVFKRYSVGNSHFISNTIEVFF